MRSQHRPCRRTSEGAPPASQSPLRRGCVRNLPRTPRPTSFGTARVAIPSEAGMRSQQCLKDFQQDMADRAVAIPSEAGMRSQHHQYVARTDDAPTGKSQSPLRRGCVRNVPGGFPAGDDQPVSQSPLRRGCVRNCLKDFQQDMADRSSSSQSPLRRGCVRNFSTCCSFCCWCRRSQSPLRRGCVRNAETRHPSEGRGPQVAIPSEAGMRSQPCFHVLVADDPCGCRNPL